MTLPAPDVGSHARGDGRRGSTSGGPPQRPCRGPVARSGPVAAAPGAPGSLHPRGTPARTRQPAAGAQDLGAEADP